MGRTRVTFECDACGHRTAQWAGRCAGCGGWGTIPQTPARAASVAASAVALEALALDAADEQRIPTGFPSVDRVLGGGIVPASVTLLAGEPGIGKSTLLLQLVTNLSGAGYPCLLASGEESRGQVAARARRLGIAGDAVAFAPGRDLQPLLAAARDARPALLVVDSIQTLRDPDAGQIPGGVSQVRQCADALVGLAKAEGIAVIVSGHVTKDGDLAGPRTLEHAVDAVLSFEGDARSGMRMLTGGKNRYGAEGEVAWFEMGVAGLREIDPSDLLVSGDVEPGCAVALPRVGRRAMPVEVQALVAPTPTSPRRQASGLDGRRFQLVAAVLERWGIDLARADLFGAASGGLRVDDPACDLAIAAALISAATGTAVAPSTAFVGEVALTGAVRGTASLEQRAAAARAAGIARVVIAEDVKGQAASAIDGIDVVQVRHIRDLIAMLRREGRRLVPTAATAVG